MGLFSLATHGLFEDLAIRRVSGMANEIINAFDEMVSRLNNASEAGEQLEGVEIIEGPVSDIRGHENLPYVQYELVRGGFLENTELNARANFKLDVLLRCGESLEKKYYDTNKVRGVLWLLQRVQNAIDGSDLGGNQNWHAPPVYLAENFEVSELRMLYDIRLTLTTKKYSRGSL